MPHRVSLGDGLMVAGFLGLLFCVFMAAGVWWAGALVGALLTVIGWVRG